MDEKTRNSNLGCLSTLILILFGLFLFGIVSLIITALFSSSKLHGDSTLITGLQLSGGILVILYLIFLALGGKLHKINLGGYADEDKNKE